MKAHEFQEALEALGWTHKDAARELRVLARGKPNRQRVSGWARGERRIPSYIAGSIETHLELARCKRAYARIGGTSTRPGAEKGR